MSVNKDITNKISIIDIIIKIKMIQEWTTFDFLCNIASVLIESNEEYGYSKLKFKMNYSTYNNDGIVNKNLIVVSNTQPSVYDTTIEKASFIFEKFEKMGLPIEIQGLYIYNLEKDFCENKIFKYKIIFTSSINNPPLESTICNINLSNN